MQSGQYLDPKNPVERGAKILNVICTYVPKGQEEGCPAFSSCGGEAIRYVENKLDTIKFNLACHKHFMAGLDYEIIIVDNDSQDPETLEFLKDCGYPVYHRENSGFSFGAFKWAWEKFGDKYDYYLFTEQDGVPAKHNWLLEIVAKFLGERDVGAVGNFVESRHIKESGQFFEDMAKAHPTLKDRDWMCNFDGFMTFTSSKILKQCGDIFLIPVTGEDIEGKANWNELYFQQPILELGYKIVSFFDGQHILWKGQYVKDLGQDFVDLPLSNLAPIILAHPGLLYDKMKDYFNWYDKKT